MTQLDWPAESTAYLGHTSGYIRVPLTNESTITETRDAGIVTKKTVTGRVYAQRTRRSRRQWEVSLVELPAELYAPLETALGDSFGLGPFSWLTPHMGSTNVLTPDTTSPSVFDVGDGPAVASDGTLVPTAISSNLDPTDVITLARDVPLAPDGRGGTASAYLWSLAPGEPATFTVEYRRGALLLGTKTAQTIAEDGERTIVHLDGVPIGATSITMTATGIRRAGGAQFTWGAVGATQTLAGRGCAKAIITNWQGDDGSIDYDGPWRSCAFTVTEVG